MEKITLLIFSSCSELSEMHLIINKHATGNNINNLLDLVFQVGLGFSIHLYI